MSNTSAHPVRILLVEDVVIAQHAAKAILEPINCKIDIAENAKKAFEFAKNNQYDLIFMDIGLPNDEDGFAISKTLRHECELNVLTPIIALTAHFDADYMVQANDTGMDGYIVKPLTTESALDVIREFTGLR